MRRHELRYHEYEFGSDSQNAYYKWLEEQEDLERYFTEEQKENDDLTAELAHLLSNIIDKMPRWYGVYPTHRYVLSTEFMRTLKPHLVSLNDHIDKARQPLLAKDEALKAKQKMLAEESDRRLEKIKQSMREDHGKLFRSNKYFRNIVKLKAERKASVI